MKKISLLAASVALALVGCGGSDGDSNTNTGTPSAGGIVITGFDGYFKNAVVFDDVNNNGVLDVNVDTVFGLTNIDGKITLPKGAKIEGSLALKTLTPGDTNKELAIKLAALSPEADTYSDFMNTYTTDMDHEGQPMANAVVFRAPVSAEDKTAVISPLTDLVAIEMAKGTSEEAAIKAVTTALGGITEQPIDLFSDFVKDAKTNLESAKLHKTAQILTESKAKNSVEYEKNAAKIAAVAQEESEKIVTDETMGSDDLLNQKPVINPSEPDVIITNYKLLVNEDAKIAIQKEISALAITEGQSFSHEITIPANLFQDKYGKDAELSNVQAISTISGKGEITPNLEGETLTLSAENLQPTSDTYTITLTAKDKATASDPVLNTLSTTFSFKVKVLNTAPVVDSKTQASIQTVVNSWKLQQGAAFSQTFSVDGLFDDREGDILTYKTNIDTVVPGLTSTFNENTGEITISGNPQPKHLGQLVFTITADDGDPATRLASEAANFTLPAIEAGEITINTNAKAELQAKAAAWKLKVGTKFNQTLNISDLFDSGVNGGTEYYAHYASKDDEVGNNIPGVDVTVNDNSGVVTLIGTPTEKTNGVMLYVAKRIKFSDDKGDYIESEMVNITLPNVKPADGEVENNLTFTESFFNNKIAKTGSFNNGDTYVSFASFKKVGSELKFCRPDDETAFADTLTKSEGGFEEVLPALDNNITDYNASLSNNTAQCYPATIDGNKLHIDMGDNNNVSIEMLYNYNNSQYIMNLTPSNSATSENDLFWLDMTEKPFYQSMKIPSKINGNSIEYTLIDDNPTGFSNDGNIMTDFMTHSSVYSNAILDATSGNEIVETGDVSLFEDNSKYTIFSKTDSAPGEAIFITNNDCSSGNEDGNFFVREIGEFDIYIREKCDYTPSAHFTLVAQQESLITKVLGKLKQ